MVRAMGNQGGVRFFFIFFLPSRVCDRNQDNNKTNSSTALLRSKDKRISCHTIRPHHNPFPSVSVLSFL
jgi:hypothetical protein